jgi:FPC/CPF motif-containing protein YcgG
MVRVIKNYEGFHLLGHNAILSVDYYRNKWHYMPGDKPLRNHSCENHKSSNINSLNTLFFCMLNQQPKANFEVSTSKVQREQAQQKTIQRKLYRLEKTFSKYSI